MAEKAEVKSEVKTEPKTGDGAMDPKSKGILIGVGLVLGVILLSNTTFNFHQPYPMNPPAFTSQASPQRHFDLPFDNGDGGIDELVPYQSYRVTTSSGLFIYRSCGPIYNGCVRCSSGPNLKEFCRANGRLKTSRPLR